MLLLLGILLALLAFAGMFDGGEGDSSSVDEVVYGREAP